MGYGKKGNMYKSGKLQMDNPVCIYISATITLDGSQDLFFQSFYKELKFPGRLEKEDYGTEYSIMLFLLKKHD